MRASGRCARDVGIAACFSLLVAGAAACTVQAAGNEPATGGGAASAEPVRAGCQGGFTGGGNGTLIDADDHIVRWSKATFDAPEEQVDTGPDPALATAVRQELEAIGFTAIAFDEPGNMTCFVTYRGHTVAWPIGDVRAPAEVVEVHDRLTSFP